MTKDINGIEIKENHVVTYIWPEPSKYKQTGFVRFSEEGPLELVSGIYRSPIAELKRMGKLEIVGMLPIDKDLLKIKRLEEELEFVKRYRERYWALVKKIDSYNMESGIYRLFNKISKV